MKLGPYLLGPNDTPENGIYTGDARDLAPLIPDESVDLVFTDPAYQNIDDYRWLAETAARVLKPDSACLAWGATPLLPTYFRVMIPPLQWAWLMYMLKSGYPTPGKPGICIVALCLWLQKGQSKTYKRIADLKKVNVVSRIEGIYNDHQWSKGIDCFHKWLDAFTLRDMVVVDFFTGGGTIPAACKMLGRRWLAFEIDPAVAEQARERVRMTQPPLFVPQPQQATLDLPNSP